MINNTLELGSTKSTYYFTNWSCLKLSGKDCLDFLNRLLTIKVSLIPIQKGSWAFLLDHRGRVQESIYLLREAEQSFIAVSESNITALYDGLDRFLFAENVHLNILQDSVCIYSQLSNQQEHHSHIVKHFASNSWTIDLLGQQQEYLSVVSDAQAQELRASYESQEDLIMLNDQEFEHKRIQQGIAHPLREYKDRSPLDVSSQGITEGKGCYPGQEVIERTLALGKPAKRTIAIKLLGDEVSLKSLIHAYTQQQKLQVFTADSEKALGILSSLSTVIQAVDTKQAIPYLSGIIQIKNRQESSDSLVIKLAEQSFDHIQLVFV